MSKELNKQPSQRQLKVGEEIRHVLSNIFLQGEIYDPDIAGVSITVSEVRVSPDLKNATAFVFPLGGEASDALISSLNKISPQIRHQLAKSIQMRFIPKITFRSDNSFQVAEDIEKLLRKVKDDI